MLIQISYLSGINSWNVYKRTFRIFDTAFEQLITAEQPDSFQACMLKAVMECYQRKHLPVASNVARAIVADSVTNTVYSRPYDINYIVKELNYWYPELNYNKYHSCIQQYFESFKCSL